MSFQSRNILREIRKTTKKSEFPMEIDPAKKIVHPLGLASPNFSYMKYADEMGSILDLLAEQGYIKYLDDEHSVFSLTQQGIHIHQHRLSLLRAYLLDKWIDILALVIAICALILSFVAVQISIIELNQQAQSGSPTVSPALSEESSNMPENRFYNVATDTPHPANIP